MDGPNGPSVYQQILSSSINVHTNSSTILPITEHHKILSKVHTTGDASVASDQIYDEIDELKYEIEARAASKVIVTDTKPSKSRRSSFLSKLLNFHRNPPHPISIPENYQTLDKPLQRDSSSSTLPKTSDVTMEQSTESLFLEDNHRLDGQIHARPYDWPHDHSLKTSTTALVIIDMQKDFASDKGYLAKQGIDNQPILNIVPKVRKLLEVCRVNGFPIYHTREGHRPDLSTLSSREKFRSKNNNSKLGIGSIGPLGRLLIRGEKGHEIIDELTPLENEQVIDKPGRSAFQHTEFRLMLNIKGIKNLIICGVTTDVCVTSTMREANDNNFDCVLVEDACAAGVNEFHKSAVDSITEEGGIFGAVTTLKDVLEQLETLDQTMWAYDATNSNKSSKVIGGLLNDNSKDSKGCFGNPTQIDESCSIIAGSAARKKQYTERGHWDKPRDEPAEVQDYVDDGSPAGCKESSGSAKSPVTCMRRQSSAKKGHCLTFQYKNTSPVGATFGQRQLIEYRDEDKREPEDPRPSGLMDFSDEDTDNREFQDVLPSASRKKSGT